MVRHRPGPYIVAPSTQGANSAAPKSKPSLLVRSPLAVNMRMAMLSPRVIDPATRLLQALYWPPILIGVLAWFVLGEHSRPGRCWVSCSASRA